MKELPKPLYSAIFILVVSLSGKWQHFIILLWEMRLQKPWIEPVNLLLPALVLKRPEPQPFDKDFCHGTRRMALRIRRGGFTTTFHQSQNAYCPKDHWTLKSGYFEDTTPAFQVQTLPLEGPRSLGCKILCIDQCLGKKNKARLKSIFSGRFVDDSWARHSKGGFWLKAYAPYWSSSQLKGSKHSMYRVPRFWPWIL